MKNLIATLFFCLFSLFIFSQTTEKEARTIPSASVKTLKGEATNTSSISNNGKPIIISFWATWCKPCIEELSNIADVYPDWQKETGVKVVAVSIDDSRTSARVAQFVNGRNWTYDVLLDENS